MKKKSNDNTHSIYDPQVVDDRVDWLNTLFRSEKYQDYTEIEKKKYTVNRDPKVPHLSKFRQRGLKDAKHRP